MEKLGHGFTQMNTDKTIQVNQWKSVSIRSPILLEADG
jgi:hypothetical protein